MISFFVENLYFQDAINLPFLKTEKYEPNHQHGFCLCLKSSS